MREELGECVRAEEYTLPLYKAFRWREDRSFLMKKSKSKFFSSPSSEI
jgi:hypothetical protein